MTCIYCGRTGPAVERFVEHCGGMGYVEIRHCAYSAALTCEEVKTQEAAGSIRRPLPSLRAG